MANVENLRNVVVMGHQGSGKTSLVESLALAAKLISTKGEVEKKNTISDYLAEEQKRGISLQTSVIPLNKDGRKVNLLDIPGNDDFIAEAIGATSVADGAILIIDASVGVQVGTVKHWNQLRSQHIPTVIFLNKMDKEGVNFEEVLSEIKEKLTNQAIPFELPDGEGPAFKGFTDLVDLEGGNDRAQELHGLIIEEVAKTDDELLEKFFMEEPFTADEIHNGLRKAVASGDVVPVLVGVSTKNVGVSELLDFVVKYLPSPADKKSLVGLDDSNKEIERKPSDDEPVSAYVFKTLVDPYSGVINLVKVVSGILRAGEDISVNGSTQRVSMLFSMTGKKMDSITELHAGDIGAITRLDNVKTGSTLSAPKNVVNFKASEFPHAVIFKCVELKNKNDESKLGPALAKIQFEDPCIEVKRNTETKQLLVGGVSSSHIEFVLGKLKDTYKIDVNVSPMKVVYRESIKKTGQAIGRYVKQSGGSGFYGVVDMRFEPCEESEFAEEVFGGAVPKNYFPAVEKGFFEALKSGPLAGFPVIGVKGVLVDGKYHPVDSNEQAFKMAAILAFKEAYPDCKPIILEPIMRIRVTIENRYTGDVLSDLNTRRAKVQNIEDGDHGTSVIEALVPEAEIIDYATQLKSITQASGFFNRNFESYEEVPEYLKEKVIKENKMSN